MLDPMKKWANEPNRAFSKEKVPMAEKHMKKSLTSLVIREMQIKTLRFHLSSVRMAIIKNTHTHTHKQMLVRMWGKRNLHILLVGM
jgi:hypothetical protein